VPWNQRDTRRRRSRPVRSGGRVPGAAKAVQYEGAALVPPFFGGDERSELSRHGERDKVLVPSEIWGLLIGSPSSPAPAGLIFFPPRWRHDQSVRHPLLKAPDYFRLGFRN